MRYRLNFNGFYDTRETLFGDASNDITEALTNVDYDDIDKIIDNCINTIKSKLGVSVNKNSIEDIQFYNQAEFAAHVMVTGQDKYLLLVNLNKFATEAELVSTMYHELCHVYQLNKLFNEGIMAYDYFKNDLSVLHEEDSDLLKAHLNDNNGHTVYWQELADKINTIIKPTKKITAYLTESVENIRPELFEEDYFRLNFDGFYDTRKTLFRADDSC